MSKKVSSNTEMIKKLHSKKNAWISPQIAQIVVFVNGLLLTIGAFLIFNYFVNEISREEYRKTSHSLGSFFVEGISGLENSMRFVSGLILLSDKSDKDMLISEIKRNVPGLSRFDQIIWIYEETSGHWQYKTVFDADRENGRIHYRLVPDKELISRLISEGVLETETLRVISDLKGMNYNEERSSPKIMSRSFAFLKTISENNSKMGVIIGISRASLLFDQRFISDRDFISKLTVSDENQRQKIYHMNRDQESSSNAAPPRKDLQQNYGFFVGDTEWTIITEFRKDSDALLLDKIPYVIFLFGAILTIVGTLFIRNNHLQSEKLSYANNALEQKNHELENEIFERERLNAALIKAEKDNRAIIDSVSDIIFETDINGNVLFLSEAWQKITGFDTEHSKDRNLFSLIHPEDQEKQRQDFEQLVQGQKKAYRNFTRLRISDGTFRAIELAVSMTRQDENKNLRVVGTMTDVEERRIVERALAEAEKKYRTIVENAAGGLYQLTPEGMYLSANPAMARILGYETIEEMLRVVKNANGIVYPDLEEREKFLKTLAEKEQIFGYETKVAKKDGTFIWVSENVRIVKDERNNILYFEGSMEDITERKKADIALLEAKMHSDIANRTKTEFIANMSHELRTPLNAIIGFSDIMKNELMGPLGQDSYRDYVKDIHESGNNLLKIINNILDISKIETGSKELNESEFKIKNLISSFQEFYAAHAKEKNIAFIDNTSELPTLIGDELLIKQVLGNICSNAIKYTPENGRITFFSDYDANGNFRLAIADTGIGMNKNEIERALAPFGQINNALDRDDSGVGLGLSLSQAIMKLHGGHIDILSEKSIGTTVSLVFPSERLTPPLQEDASKNLSIMNALKRKKDTNT